MLDLLAFSSATGVAVKGANWIRMLGAFIGKASGT